MENSFNHKFSFLYFNILFFLLLSSLNLIFSQEINHIIRLGDHPFRYVRISLNSEGDMVADTSAYEGNNKRRFFGLKKNGKYYFKDSNGFETPYLEMTNGRKKNVERIEGESIFIKLGSNNPVINGKEFLMGTSKNEDNYCELYFFEENNILEDTTENLFGDISSDVFSAIKLPVDTDSNFHYIFSYIEEEKKYIITDIYLNEDMEDYYKTKKLGEFDSSKRNIASSFFTEKNKYVCFIHQEKSYKAIVF